LIIISQGPPMWLSNSAWSREVRVFLERWTGGPVNAACGTDRAALEERTLRLRRCGYEQTEVVARAYENAVDCHTSLATCGRQCLNRFCRTTENPSSGPA
jgi:hypothetical protein